MLKAAVRDRDRTTTGGYVIAPGSTYFDNGKPLALNGAKATCVRCNGVFPIYGTGHDIMDEGQRMVVDGDLVLCPCKSNRVRAGRDAGYFLQTSGRSGSARVMAAPPLASSSALASAFDEEYVLRDGATGRPIANVFYRLTSTSGVIVEGMTDRSGKTQRIKTSSAERISVKIGELE
ncbi:hypothetical protein A9R05_00315 [Burkholderia sp. KK1]|nr:hypothetical protein A9R05_00315 [Burkholderia sp. KK1]